MVQRQPAEQVTLEQVLTLVDKLPPTEQEQLRKNLSNRTWGQRWRQLVKDVGEDNKDLPALSEKEVITEMKAIKDEIRTERAKGSN
jgi:Tfp pilus assembly pilus retraction ATPase PilT